MADAQTATDNNGQYAFTGLRAGTYAVEISGFDMDEVGFGSVSSSATVGVGESKIISFDGTYLRTAGIMGQVSVEGVGLAGVTVTMTGEGEDETDVTDAGGLYGFSKLKAGDYSVAISGFDPDEVEFSTTSMNVSVALGETANIPFEGTLLRTSGISGRVSVEGMGLDNVEVALTGAATATTMTANGGQYAFAGLAEGTYVLNIMNPNEAAYSFEETSATIVLGDAESNITNFEGTHTRTASISGMLFIDEVMQDKMLTTGEPSITAALAPLVASGVLDPMMLAGLLANAKVIVRGPSLNDPPMEIAINADGSFTTGEALVAGSYQVELPANNEMVAAALMAAGVVFVGESMVVAVEAGGMATANLPFRITMQTVSIGAVMGMGDDEIPADRSRVGGVELELYPTAQDAEDGTNLLVADAAETDEMTGMAAFTFARADDTSPGGDDTDNLVFVKVSATGHDDLVSDNDIVEIEYPGVARVHSAPAHIRLLNVGVYFDFWVKSDETARDGDEGLGGWNTEVFMGEDTVALMMEDADGDTVNATMATDTTKGPMTLGKGTFSYMLEASALADGDITFSVLAVQDDSASSSSPDQPDMGERWTQSDPVMHTHDPLKLPEDNEAGDNDVGPIRITYTTQAVYVGIHRELDDRTGFTDFLGVGDGDSRPTGHADKKISVSLKIEDDRGRLRTLEYDHDFKDETLPQEATESFTKLGTSESSNWAVFTHVPADKEITIVVDPPRDIMIVPEHGGSTSIEAFGDNLDAFPDGVMKGSFGTGSGGRPDVWICPLQRLEDTKNCSTFAYKWATGSISGQVENLRKGDEDIVITLEPVSSNEDYEDDLADDLQVDYSPAGDPKYEFDGVADGKYRVILEAAGDGFKGDSTAVIQIEHDESVVERLAADEKTGQNVGATDLRGVIKGVIGNDVAGTRDVLAGNEAIPGIVVNLHHASLPISSGRNAGRRSEGAAVTDENGDPVTAETDENGVFVFESLEMGKKYFLKPQSTDKYKAVRNGDTGIANHKTTQVVEVALTEPEAEEADSIEVGVPEWDVYANTLSGHEANDFALLYKDGEITGEVSDPSAKKAHENAEIELYLCKTATSGDNQCLTYTSSTPTEEVGVGSNGAWVASNLQEGVYEVLVRLPAGYEHTDMDGPDPSAADSYAEGTDGYYSIQGAVLEGGRSSEDTETFHIVDRNAGKMATIENDGIEIDDEDCAGAADADAVCEHIERDDTSFKVKITASEGATLRVSPENDDPRARGSVAAVNIADSPTSTGTTVTLSMAGTETFFVHAKSGNGYVTNLVVDPNDADAMIVEDEDGFKARRDADVRVSLVDIDWVGDGITLDREELGLGTFSGENEGVITALSYEVDESDRGNSVPVALTLSAEGMDDDFDDVKWGTHSPTQTGVGTCSFTDSPTDDEVDATLPANVPGTKGSVTVCLQIIDSDEAAANEDANDDNNYEYIIVLTRK